MRKIQLLRICLGRGLPLQFFLILVTLLMTSCQFQSTENPEPSAAASPSLNIVTPTFPSSATVACVPLQPGMSVIVTPISHTRAKVDLKGFQPEENITLKFSTADGTTEHGFTSGPISVAKDGSYSFDESLAFTPDRKKIHWQVQVIHSHGAACMEIDMPDN